jgi:MraZ protein
MKPGGTEWDKVGNHPMLYGEYRHSLDDKGRVSLPAKFRAELGERVVVSKGLEKCLFVFSTAEFESLLKRLGDMPLGRKEAREFSRFLLAGSADAEVDSHGRILLPAALRDYAGLEKDAVLIGVSTRAEIWRLASYEEFSRRAEGEYEDVAGKLLDLGI